MSIDSEDEFVAALRSPQHDAIARVLVWLFVVLAPLTLWLLAKSIGKPC